MSEATATIVTESGGLHRVELGGSFSHPHWLAFLCGGLSAEGVSVVSGRASRVEPLRWEGHFLVDGPVDGLDVVALAGRRPAVRDALVPRLTSYTLARRADRDLELGVEAPDERGFLGRLLSRVSLLTLLPVAVEIDTRGGRVSDRFVLSGIGSSKPGAEVQEALATMLETMQKTAAR